jgi:hypothetical protein
MRVRRETAEHPFCTLKMRIGETHFLMKRLLKIPLSTNFAIRLSATVRVIFRCCVPRG